MNDDRTRDERFWGRVHEALDRREDPLDDAEIVAGLEQDPARLQEYGRLVAALRSVRSAQTLPARPARRSWPWMVALAAAAAAVLALLWPSAAVLPAGAPLRVLRLEVQHVSAAATTTWRQRDGVLELTARRPASARVRRLVVDSKTYGADEVQR